MANLPTKPCARCRRRVPIGTRHCPDCATKVQRMTDQARRADPAQGPVARFRSSAAWQKHRAWRLRVEPLCRPCRASGQITAGVEVDHIAPLATPEGWARRLDPTNTQSICRTHHAAKTAGER